MSAPPAVAAASPPAPPPGRLVSLAVTCSLPVLLITADVLAGGPLRHVDDFLAAGGWHRADAAITSVAYAFDRLGQRAVAGSILVAVAAFLAWRIRSWRPLVVTGAGLGLLNLVVGAMKLTIGRSKPLSGQDLLYVGGSQFPSGHAANALVTWGLLAYLAVAYGRRRWPPRLMLGAAGAITLAVCAASLYLDYHWLSDLAAGVVLGAVLLALLVAWDLTRVETPNRWSSVDEATAALLRENGPVPARSLASVAPLTGPVHAAGRQV